MYQAINERIERSVRAKRVRVTKDVGEQVEFNNEKCEVIDVDKKLGLLMLFSSSNKMYNVYEEQLNWR